MAEIVLRHPDSVGNSHRYPDDKWPPYSFEHKHDDGCPLHDTDRDSGKKQISMNLL